MELAAKNVSYSYHTKRQVVCALQQVTYTFKSGVVYALEGKSGSGKTTLLSLLAGLDIPESGSIYFNGKDMRVMDLDRFRRENASVIYQQFNLFPRMTVQENVIYPLLLNNVSRNEATKQAQKMLEQVGIGAPYWKRFPSTLSGGEQQRVAIARALAINAEIILADEPTGNLDSENTNIVMNLLRKLAHQEQRCVIVVTHDSDVSNMADVVVRMEKGILFGGTE